MNALYFIDSHVADYARLIQALPTGSAWRLLDPGQDGLAQMAEEVAHLRDLDAIHVLAHGAPGEIVLGSTTLDLDALATHQEALGRIAASLSETADLLFYGCETGQGPKGQALLQGIAALTGADVAASDDLTGALALQGDWQLEVHVGAIEAPVLEVSDYAYVLPEGAPTFKVDGDGWVSTSFGYNALARSVTVLSDGRLLLAGEQFENANGMHSFVLARYFSDGRLDTSFSDDGLLTLNLGASWEDGYRLLPQNDGGVQIVGYRDSGAGNRDFVLMRVDGSGEVAPLIVMNRLASAAMGSAADYAQALVALADGKTLLAGQSGEGQSADFVLMRSLSDGRLDPEFGDGGLVVTAIANGQDVARGVALQADGKILVVGESSPLQGDSDIALVRYNADGSLDTSFGQSGVVVTDLGGWESGYSVTVQPDGQIVVVGGRYSGGVYGSYDMVLLRYNADGSLDTRFDPVNTLDNTPVFVEDGPAVVLDDGVMVDDPEFALLNGGLGDYAGASLVLSRQGGGQPEDVFGFDPAGAVFTAANGELQANGQTFATYVNATGGLSIAFTSAQTVATQALVNAVLQQLTYANTSSTPPGSVDLEWVFSDGVQSLTQTQHVQIQAVAPVAEDDVATAVETGTANAGTPGSDATGNVLANDSDSDGILMVTAVRQAGWGDAVMPGQALDGFYGTLTVQADGSFRFEVDESATAFLNLGSGQTLTQSFDYTVTNGSLTDTARLTLTIHGADDANTPPEVALGDGYTTRHVADYNSGATDMLLQSDGKIVVSGYSQGNFNLLRYNADGSADTQLDGDGLVITEAAGMAAAIAQQADGRIVLAGSQDVLDPDGYAHGEVLSLVRYNADGSLDASFGTAGRVQTDTGSPFQTVQDLWVLPDQTILAAGTRMNDQDQDVLLVRYLSDGSLDTSFGNAGWVSTDLGSTADSVNHMTVQSDGRILLVGGVALGVNGEMALVRYLADGSLDSGFGQGGKVLTGLNADYADARAVAVASDGSLLVAGYVAEFGGSSGMWLMRYQADGTLDTAFGDQGHVSLPGSYTQAMAVQTDGQIVLAGSVSRFGGEASDIEIVRLNSDGSLDDSFGWHGSVTLDLGTVEGATGVEIQADGRIVVTGHSVDSGRQNGDATDYALIRLNSDGSLDTSLTGDIVPRLAEQGPAVVMSPRIHFSDAELDARHSGWGDYREASLTISRVGGAQAEDLFGLDTLDGLFSLEGEAIYTTYGAYVGEHLRIGTFSQQEGVLNITFDTAWDEQPGSAVLNEMAQHLTYRNTSTSPGTGVSLQWVFSDGADSVTTTTQVEIVERNDAPTFDSGLGWYTRAVVADDATMGGLWQQADGRLLAVGTATDFSWVDYGWEGSSDIALWSMTSSGQEDAEFGPSGTIRLPTGYEFTLAQGALLDDGGLLLSGVVKTTYLDQGGFPTNNDDIALFRLLADGTFDTGFGSQGQVITDWGDDLDAVYGLAVQDDGRILVAGHGGDAPTGQLALARYLANGELDTGFGTGGYVQVTLSTGDEWFYSEAATSLALQADGQILMLARFHEFGLGDVEYTRLAVLRFNSHGELDGAFGENGQVSMVLANASGQGNALCVLAEGGLLVAGADGGEAFLLRFTSQGVLDAGFGEGGKVVLDLGQTDEGWQQLLQQSDGKIVVAGWSGHDFVVARYDRFGQLDTGFGNQGLTCIDPGGATQPVFGSLTLQEDGKLLLTGSVGNEVVVLRLNTDGSLDTAFGNGEAGVGANSFYDRPTFVEDGPAIALDTDVHVFDPEFAALNGGMGNYAGLTLSLERHGGALAEDLFSLDTAAAGFKVIGDQLCAGALAFATVSSTAGHFSITFTSDATPATQALVDDVVSHLRYANGSDILAGSVQFDWVLSDGDQGSTGQIQVELVAVNDAPVVVHPLADHSMTGYSQWGVVLPEGSFIDPDATGELLFSASLADGAALPDWLQFDEDTLTLTASPSNLHVGSFDIAVMATDSEGLSGRDVFQLTVQGQRTVVGGADDDTLYGTGMADSLDGGLGADTLSGGAGNDTYWVDNAADVISEAVGRGTDSVNSTVSYSLDANVENLRLVGQGKLNATGNELGNSLSGNDSDNRLDGQGGMDTLMGGRGNDVYLVDNAKDRVVENSAQGSDTVMANASSVATFTLAANVENLTLSGSAALRGVGNAMANILVGNDQSNVLNGKSGNDTLTGGQGADVFVFDTRNGVDSIRDFTHSTDRIHLDDSAFSALASGLLADAAFAQGAGWTSAHDATDRIIYNPTSGKLYYDADGQGGTASVLVANLGGGGLPPPMLSASDFLVV